MNLDPLSIQATRCNRCQKPISQDKAETCWYCIEDLCSECWDKWGHCGHPEAEAMNEMARAIHQPTGPVSYAPDKPEGWPK